MIWESSYIRNSSCETKHDRGHFRNAVFTQFLNNAYIVHNNYTMNMLLFRNTNMKTVNALLDIAPRETFRYLCFAIMTKILSKALCHNSEFLGLYARQYYSITGALNQIWLTTNEINTIYLRVLSTSWENYTNQPQKFLHMSMQKINTARRTTVEWNNI